MILKDIQGRVIRVVWVAHRSVLRGSVGWGRGSVLSCRGSVSACPGLCRLEEKGEQGDEEKEEKAATDEGGHQVDGDVGVVVEQLGRLFHFWLHKVILCKVQNRGCKKNN